MVKNTPILLVPLLVACGGYVKTVEPHDSATLVDPETEACLAKDATPFFQDQMEGIQECTQYISCRKHPGMTITLMAGCNGTEGGLYVLSDEVLKKFNACIAEKGDSWDYSPLCDSSECDCAWSYKLDVVCTEK
jgi:hypothetical protein